MKKIYLLLTLLGCLFIACQQSNEVQEDQLSEDFSTEYFIQEGANCTLKTLSSPIITRFSDNKIEQFYLKTEKDGNVFESIVVQEYISDSSIVLYHYTVDQVLLATIRVENGYITDLKLEYDDETIATRGFKDWYNKLNERYREVKADFERDNPIVCDLAGAICVVVSAAIAVVTM